MTRLGVEMESHFSTMRTGNEMGQREEEVGLDVTKFGSLEQHYVLKKNEFGVVTKEILEYLQLNSVHFQAS